MVGKSGRNISFYYLFKWNQASQREKRLEVERQRQQRLAKEAEERRRREEERQRQEEERQRQVEERRRQVEERQRQVEILKQKEKQYITNYDLIERLYRKNPDSPFAAISASHKKTTYLWCLC